MEDNVESRTMGRACFRKMRNRFVEDLSNNFLHQMTVQGLHQSQIPSQQLNQEQEREKQFKFILPVYDIFFHKHVEQLAHYYRSLFHVIKLVSESPVLESEAERKKYVSIVRATLSAYEIAMLFYNCIQPDFSKFLEYAVRFDLFEHLNNDLLSHKSHREFLELALRDAKSA
jgi:hypothetical protein